MKSFTKIIAVLIFSAFNLLAQGEEPIAWTLSTDSKPLTANTAFEAKLTAKLGEGWHLYSITQPSGGPNATTIAIKDGIPFKLADKIKAAPPIKKYDDTFRMDTEFYAKEAEFILPVQADTGVSDAKELIVEVNFQLCDDKVCLPPKTVEVKATAVAPVQMVASTKENASAAIKTTQLKVGDTVPNFAFTDFEGKPRNFSEYKGKMVLLDFWATWCSPCLKDIPKLKVVYDKYKAQNFEIIGMDSETIGDEETPDPEFAKETHERALNIVKTRGANWSHANAATAVPIAKKIFDVKALPTKILIDKNGKIVAIVGEKDDLDKAVTALIESK